MCRMLGWYVPVSALQQGCCPCLQDSWVAAAALVWLPAGVRLVDTVLLWRGGWGGRAQGEGWPGADLTCTRRLSARHQLRQVGAGES